MHFFSFSQKITWEHTHILQPPYFFQPLPHFWVLRNITNWTHYWVSLYCYLHLGGYMGHSCVQAYMHRNLYNLHHLVSRKKIVLLSERNISITIFVLNIIRPKSTLAHCPRCKMPWHMETNFTKFSNLLVQNLKTSWLATSYLSLTSIPERSLQWNVWWHAWKILLYLS